jgi:hypothetical protein
MSNLILVICFRKISYAISCMKGFSRAGISASAVRRHTRLCSAGNLSAGPRLAAAEQCYLHFTCLALCIGEGSLIGGKRLIRCKAGWGRKFPILHCLAWRYEPYSCGSTVFKVQSDKQAVAVLYMGLGAKIQSLEIQIVESMCMAILNTIVNNLN